MNFGSGARLAQTAAVGGLEGPVICASAPVAPVPLGTANWSGATGPGKFTPGEHGDTHPLARRFFPDQPSLSHYLLVSNEMIDCAELAKPPTSVTYIEERTSLRPTHGPTASARGGDESAGQC
jgi:hypothetical protein